VWGSLARRVELVSVGALSVWGCRDGWWVGGRDEGRGRQAGLWREVQHVWVMRGAEGLGSRDPMPEVGSRRRDPVPEVGSRDPVPEVGSRDPVPEVGSRHPMP
jgi:hypothetical protein